MALSLYSLTWHVAIFLKFSTFLYFIFVKNKHTNSITFVINLFEKIADAGVNVNVFNQALVGGGKMDISLIISDVDVPAVVDIINDLKPQLNHLYQ